MKKDWAKLSVKNTCTFNESIDCIATIVEPFRVSNEFVGFNAECEVAWYGVEPFFISLIKRLPIKCAVNLYCVE